VEYATKLLSTPTCGVGATRCPQFATQQGRRALATARSAAAWCSGGGKDSSFTIYAGTLDDPSSFHPTAAIFARSRPAWAVIPPGLTIYDAMPPE